MNVYVEVLELLSILGVGFLILRSLDTIRKAVVDLSGQKSEK